MVIDNSKMNVSIPVTNKTVKLPISKTFTGKRAS